MRKILFEIKLFLTSNELNSRLLDIVYNTTMENDGLYA